ncbi:MAG: sterol desaturase family protein [Proteobacteria bacterium]|nr:sterol desaturase family protein [Pseudomonadota bacterium]
MNLLALAVPFFLVSLLVEIFVDWRRGTGYYRSNDAINSISAGVLSTTTGYFSKFVEWLIWGLVLKNFAIFDMPLDWFDFSARGILLWVIAAVAWDFCYYWQHRFGHEISVFWASHSVHHQSEDYNLSTALRQSSTSFFYSWIFYLPLFLVGFPIEVLITVGAANLLYQFWVHTQHIGRLGLLDRIMVTPSNHRVHHAQNERYIDKNYGGIFVLWDRAFGTFAEEADEEPVVFGVRKPLSNWNPFWANIQVFDYLLFDARRTRLWRDKIGIWFHRTGWRPADVEVLYPKRHTDLASFEKFDPQLTLARRRYVLGQFFVVILSSMMIAEGYVTGGAQAVLTPCVLLWVQLYALGLLNGGQTHAINVELVRLFVITPLGVLVLQLVGFISPLTTFGWAVLGAYIFGSFLWLRKS